jgi:UPF0271 protein
MLKCDLNCDVGEGMGDDGAIMPYITSASIACGFHAGDEDSMKKTVELCLQHGVLIGAHPSYPDRENFGRVDMFPDKLKAEEIPEMIFDQISALKRICEEAGTWLHHVKPHGALYNRAAKDAEVSKMICNAIRDVDPSLVLYGLSNSITAQEAAYHDLQFMHEAFADRTYQDDGSLTPRSRSNALITDSSIAVGQVLQMIEQHSVKTVTGKNIPMRADTICIHGDGVNAVHFAKEIYNALSILSEK